MTLRNPSESEVRYEKPLMNTIVLTHPRPVARRGGKISGGSAMASTRKNSGVMRARCKSATFEIRVRFPAPASAEVFYAECPADGRENGVSDKRRRHRPGTCQGGKTTCAGAAVHGPRFDSGPRLPLHAGRGSCGCVSPADSDPAGFGLRTERRIRGGRVIVAGFR